MAMVSIPIVSHKQVVVKTTESIIILANRRVSSGRESEDPGLVFASTRLLRSDRDDLPMMHKLEGKVSYTMSRNSGLDKLPI